MSRTGDIFDIESEAKFEWKLKDFSSLSDEKDKCYFSPKIYFSDTSWNLLLYPNGSTKHDSVGWISVSLTRCSNGSPINLQYTIEIKSAEGNKVLDHSSTAVFDKKYVGLGLTKVLTRSALIEKKAEYLTSDVLTISCCLKHSERKDTAGSLFNRLNEVSENLSEIYRKSHRADLLLKLDDGNIPAHKMILETRSPVFAAMFRHDTKENRTGKICIDDVDCSTMTAILYHMYSGQFQTLTTENVVPIYIAADKYDIKHLRMMCIKFIYQNLSVEWVFDVIKFAELYQLEEITLRAREFFKENANNIMESEKWRSFVKDNNDTAVELLSTVVKTLLQK